MFINGAVNNRVHNAPWSDCQNKNVFSDRLNREYDKSTFLKYDGKLFPWKRGRKGSEEERKGKKGKVSHGCQWGVDAPD